MSSVYNLKSPSVKRLMREAQELRVPTEEYYAQPLEGNLFEWHFTVRGPPQTDFDGGIYHGRITLPTDYPMKPPSIILLTPNGRFEINKKICLSISGHHPESWQPSWSIRTALLAIIGFMPTHGNGAIGSLEYSPEERRALAKKSKKWCCSECGSVENLLGKNAMSDSSVENEAEKQNLLDINRTVDEESSSQVTTTHIEEMNIRPEFSFAPEVDSMLGALQHSGSSNLAHCLSPDHARQRMFSPQVNNQENPSPILVETLAHVRTDPEKLLVKTICTICIYVIVVLLCILIIRRLFFYH